MFFNSTAAVELESQELEYLEENEVEGGGLPYLQILTHPNEDIVDVKDARPWGIFLNSENAEAINFKPDDNWKPVTFYTVEGQGFDKAVLEIPAKKKAAYASAGQEITEQSGYFSTTLMFHLIYQSETEVERKEMYQGRPSYKFAGLRWGTDEHKEAMAELLKERDADDNATHRWCQRYLFILVGADGNPLHDGVISYRAKGGAGGSFSMEMNELYKDLNDAYGKGKGNQRLNLFSGKNRHGGDMRSFVRLAMQFDLYKNGKDRAPYLVPVGRVLPTGNPAETKTKAVTRGKDNDRTVTLYPSLLIHGASTQMMVPQSSPVGGAIRQAIEEYASFPLPMQGKEGEGVDAATAQGNRPYSGKGIIDMASMQASPEGWADISLLTETGSVVLRFDSLADLDNIMAAVGSVSVVGTIPAAGGPVLVQSWSADAPPVETAVQQALVEDF
jgi:hypothetical protein